MSFNNKPIKIGSKVQNMHDSVCGIVVNKSYEGSFHWMVKYESGEIERVLNKHLFVYY